MGLWVQWVRIWPKLELSSWRTGWLVLEEVEEGKKEHKDGEERGLAHRAEYHQRAQIPSSGGLVLLPKPSSDLRKSSREFELLMKL